MVVRIILCVGVLPTQLDGSPQQLPYQTGRCGDADVLAGNVLLETSPGIHAELPCLVDRATKPWIVLSLKQWVKWLAWILNGMNENKRGSQLLLRPHYLRSPWDYLKAMNRMSAYVSAEE